MICFAAIAPHPPVIVPGIGKKHDLELVSQTIEAMEKLRENLEKANPDVILIISPHAPFEPWSFGINSAKILEGSLLDFGLEKTFKFENDLALAEKILNASLKAGIDAHFYAGFLDHGALVPLYYLAKNIKAELIHLSFSFMDFQVHYDYGKIIGNICAPDPQRIAIIASGDLSHRLVPGAPAGYSPQGKIFDKKIIELLGQIKVEEILNLDREFVGEAGECGLRSFIILLGILKSKYNFRLLSYEGPFGVGYLTARLI
ncbi:hypothetical protein KAU09_00350 [Candidatus Parcubacteria bacterium]|nr:hypothetical protein [Candidatus Parcubacteria bacterium]